MQIWRLLAVVECGSASGGGIYIRLLHSVMGGPIAGGPIALLCGMLVGLVPGGVIGLVAALIVKYGFARFVTKPKVILWVAFLSGAIGGGVGTHVILRLFGGMAGL